ncbi:MAG: hypothetical protein ACRCVT_15335 [Leadbetterella sp.]
MNLNSAVGYNEKSNEYSVSFLYTSLLTFLFFSLLFFLKLSFVKPEDLTSGLMGVDLNYGVDEKGSGTIQTLNKANPSPNTEEMAPDKGEDKPVKSEITPPVSKPVKEAAPKPSKVNELTGEEDTKVVRPKTETKTTPTKVISPVATAKVETKPKVESKPSPPAPPARTVDAGSVMKKSSTGAAGSNGSIGNKAGTGGNNNGDGKNGEVGDQGGKDGTLDGKSLYGKRGTGGNGPGGNGNGTTSVNISGWKNRGALNLGKDNSKETGRIKFTVIIDEFGDIVQIAVKESSLSPSVTNFYKSQVMKKLKATLVAEGTPPAKSTGTITINITRE